jgi:hypothetical protein
MDMTTAEITQMRKAVVSDPKCHQGWDDSPVCAIQLMGIGWYFSAFFVTKDIPISF